MSPESRERRTCEKKGEKLRKLILGENDGILTPNKGMGWHEKGKDVTCRPRVQKVDSFKGGGPRKRKK